MDKRLLVLVILSSIVVLSSAKVPFGEDKFIGKTLANDTCNQWPTCTVCLQQKFCGWCSNNVIYQDGSPGFQCAGFAVNTTNPFVCYGTYSTDQCAVGYNCNSTSKNCSLAAPGNGVPLDACLTSCNPKYYTCAPNNATCVETSSQQGVPLGTCQAQCQSQNSTPSALIGTWRGVEISAGYIKGEWDMTITNTSVITITSPSGFVLSGTVSSVDAYIVITITSGAGVGLKTYALYQYVPGAVTIWMTLASSKPGAAAPASFDEAMTSPSQEEFVYVKCLNPANCDFNAPGLVQKWKNLAKLAGIRLPLEDDHCSPYPNCTDCLDHPYCGWCSTKVIYRGGVPGANCAGFNSNGTDNPFVCYGSYSTAQCPLPPPTYACNATTNQCYLASTGGSLQACNATCGKNNSQIKYKCDITNLQCVPDNTGQDVDTCNATCVLRPFPVILYGIWRGLEVSEDYVFGEWRLEISASDTYTSYFSFMDPRNITLSGYMDHVAAEAVLRVHVISPVPFNMYSLYEVAYGPETNYLDLANSAANALTYPSFIQAMTGEGMSEHNLVKCLNPNNCKFM